MRKLDFNEGKQGREAKALWRTVMRCEAIRGDLAAIKDGGRNEAVRGT